MRQAGRNIMRRAQDALRHAQAADRHLGAFESWISHIRVAPASSSPGLLEGWTCGVKDNIDVANLPSRAGSDAFPSSAVKEDSTLASRVRAAGAVILGKTRMHELAAGATGYQERAGPAPRNPWDATLAPGGSSSGSAVATSAGLVRFALGTDTGGSVRIPAAWNGVVGLKLSAGAVPLDGVLPLAPSLDSVGVLARSVRDAALVRDALLGRRAPGETTRRLLRSAGGPAGDLTGGGANDAGGGSGASGEEVSLAGVSVGLLPDHELGAGALCTGGRAAYERSVAQLAGLGARMVPLQLPCGLEEMRRRAMLTIRFEAYARR